MSDLLHFSQAALDGLFGGSAGVATADSGTTTTATPPPTTGGTGAGVTTSTPVLKAALAAIQRAYTDGQTALKSGDFAAYGQAQKRLQAAIADAVAAAPSGSAAFPAPSGTKTTAPAPGATAKP